MKKIPIYIFIIIILVAGLFNHTVKLNAQQIPAPIGTCSFLDKDPISETEAQCTQDGGVHWTPPVGTPPTATPGGGSGSTSGYHLLQPLNGPGGKTIKDFDPTGANAFGDYLNIMISIFIGLCAVLAVVMIVIGGIEYSTSELISSKEAGIEKAKGAILGLLLALSAYGILKEINPDLLNTGLDIQGATLNVTLQDFTLSPEKYLVPLGKTGKYSHTNCDENEVAASNQTANAGLSNAQIHTLACIGGIESGCQKLDATNFKWGSGSSAYGPFQILLQGHADCFESNVCRQAAGVTGPLNCAAGFRGGNPIPNSPIVAQCRKAADNFTCSVSAAACLIKKRPSFGDWDANAALPKCL